MSMRYIIRREKPDDLTDLMKRFAGLTEKLGQPGENLKRTVADTLSPMRSVNYKFVTQKVAAGWQWVCHSIELVGETETDFLALAHSFGLGKDQLTHLS